MGVILVIQERRGVSVEICAWDEASMGVVAPRIRNGSKVADKISGIVGTRPGNTAFHETAAFNKAGVLMDTLFRRKATGGRKPDGALERSVP